MERQARDAPKEVILLNRAYLAVETWMIPGPILGQNERIEIQFSVRNPSNTAARIEKIEYTLQGKKSTELIGHMLTPGEKRWFRLLARDVKSKEVLRVEGRITYTDIFHKERHRKFAKTCVLRLGHPYCVDTEGVGLNDEEEWDKQPP